MLANTFLHEFQHGVHPPEHKDYTAALPTQRMPFMDQYILPLNQNLGAPPQPVVSVGDRVLRGQPIAEPKAFFSSTLHSPVTGWIRAIGKRRLAEGDFQEAIEIEADPYATQRLDPQPRPDWRKMSRDELANEVKRAGIVGLGGAALPAHVKYVLREGVKIKTIIANGAECEPYLTNDHRIMLERPQAVLQGLEILQTLLEAEQCLIGVELNKADAIAELQRHIKPDQSIKVVPLRVKYPQGDSKMLIKSLLGIEVPKGVRSADLGIIMNNVGTLAAIADWFEQGLPYIDRRITVSGPGVKQPANLLVPLGTPVREVLRLCGGLREDTKEVIVGGPMMGIPIASLDAPIIKISAGVLAFTDKEAARPQEYPCIRCGRCVEACPYFLNPSKLARLAKARLFEEMKNAGVGECVECGSCTYACPSGIPIVQLIRSARADISRKKGKSS
ncbi:electron transporter RnfC [Achromatium sp. WMS3]|nr:electron transporter RnfC [Achromatium sp. WMS3]